jgi:hypothetical protein
MHEANADENHKESFGSRWLMPVILSTWEAEIRKIVV